MMKKDIAVIGCGYWGKNLVRNFYKLGRLAVICDLNQKALESASKMYKVRFCEDYRDLLEDKKIKAVVISTPATTHYKIAKDFIMKGKDVLVEKPMTMNIGHALDLIGLARNKNKIIMVDHVLHYHPAIVKLKTVIKKGVLGKIRYIYSNRLNIGKLRKEENILWSFAPHDISVILSIVGRMPTKLFAYGEAYLQPKVHDITVTNLYFPGKIQANIFVSWLHPFKEQKLVIVGEKKMAVFNDLEKNKLLLYSHRIKWKGGIPVASKAPFKVIKTKNEEPLRNACKHFLHCIKKRTTPLTSAEEGLKVLKVLRDAQHCLDNSK